VGAFLGIAHVVGRLREMGIATRGRAAIVLPVSEDHAARLHVAFTGLLGRRVLNRDIWTAFGISEARYYQIARKDSSQLLQADRLADAARNLGVNPVELLVSLGIINTRDAKEYIDKKQRELSQALGLGLAADSPHD